MPMLGGFAFFLVLTRVCLFRTFIFTFTTITEPPKSPKQQEVVGRSSPVALTFSPSNSWQPPDSSSAATNSFVPNSGHNASAKQATDTVGYATESASQGFFQNPNPVTPSVGQPFVPTLDSVSYHVDHFANTNGQSGQAYHLADFNAPMDFDAANLEIAPIDTTSFSSLHWWSNDTAIWPQVDTNSFNSFNQLSNDTAIGPQADINSFDSLLLPHTTYMPSAPELPTPFPGVVAAANANVNTNPNTCNYPGCGRTFGRPTDLARHRRKHGVHQHPCPVRGCPRTFYRTDKLRDHQRQGHRMFF